MRYLIDSNILIFCASDMDLLLFGVIVISQFFQF
jgi:hypothetical protein